MKRGILLLFIILSVCGSAQQLPPPPAMSNLEQKRLIDEFIEVSNYKEALTNYAKLNLGLKMFELVRKEGIIARGIRNLVAVAPPLIIKREEVDFLVGGIRKALDKLW